MDRKFVVEGNSVYDHAFKLGQVVTLVQEYPDGVYEVSGDYYGREVTQDVHPRDLEELN